MTPEQRRTIQASLQRGQTGDAGTNFGQQPLQTLATDRQRRFANELRNNPQLKAQIMRIAANEQGNNPKGTQAVMESLFNRAAVRNTSLAQEAQWHRGGRGYYQMGSMGRGALENPRSRAMLEQGFNNVVGGSNISNFATDNSSGGLARREMASGRFRFASTYGGETFSSPGTAEPGHARTWQSWSQQMRQPAAPATPPPFQTNDIIPAGQFI
jgi:hypothetical protein